MKLAVFGLVALTFLNGCGDEGEVGQLGDASGGRDGLMELSLAVQALSPELIYEPPVPLSATDLDFNPEREGELWITLRPHYDESLLCTEESESVGACQQLEGRVVIVEDATGRDLQTQELSARVAQDPNGWHFLRRPPAIAFGPDNTFGTCGEARTGNFEDTDPDYIGPTLWSSDPQIFAQLVSQGANGSHIDMLHSSPFCVGIAHDVDNVYWVFNGQQGSVDRYDFNEPHEPGGEDHSDGELLRYVDGSLSRVPSVPGHMVIDGDAQFIYIADTGAGRIVGFDITSGEVGESIPSNDPLTVRHAVNGVDLKEVVAPGIVERPAGIALYDGTRLVNAIDADALLVTDNATGRLHLFSKAGASLADIETGLPEGALGGVVQGPDGLVYLVDLLEGRVFRFE